MWPGVGSDSSRSQRKAAEQDLSLGGGGASGSAVAPPLGLGEATLAVRVRGQGRALCSRTDGALAQETQEWPSGPPSLRSGSSHPPSSLQTNLQSLIIRLASCSELSQLS